VNWDENEPTIRLRRKTWKEQNQKIEIEIARRPSPTDSISPRFAFLAAHEGGHLIRHRSHR